MFLSRSALWTTCVVSIPLIYNSACERDVGDPESNTPEDLSSTNDASEADETTGEDSSNGDGDSTPTGDTMDEDPLPRSKRDIVFVVDNSSSMGGHQAYLTKRVTEIVDRLLAQGFDLRIGVTTTNAGHWNCPAPWTGGELRVSSCREREIEFTDPSERMSRFHTACTQHCDAGVNLERVPTSIESGGTMQVRPWIEANAATTSLAAGLDGLGAALQCMIPQGIDGCGYESTLQSVYNLVHKSSNEAAEHYGFLRPDADLELVVLTDELDCSVNLSHESLGTNLKDVFSPHNETFWVEGQTSPTSAICFRAGAECSEQSDDVWGRCESVDFDVRREPIVDQEAASRLAVLGPVSRYIEQLRELQAEKQKLNPNARILVHLVAGFDANGEPLYRTGIDGSALEKEVYPIFGLGFGCQGVTTILSEYDPNDPENIIPAGKEDMYAFSPVRLLEFARAFPGKLDDDLNYVPSLHSICENWDIPPR